MLNFVKKTETLTPDGVRVRLRKKYRTNLLEEVLDVYSSWYDLFERGSASPEEKKKCVKELENFLRNPLVGMNGEKILDFGVVSPVKFGGVPNGTEMHLVYCRQDKHYYFQFLPEGTGEQDRLRKGEIDPH